MSQFADTPIDFERRFGGLNRLYGAHALNFLSRSHVLIVGLGGVGSWAAEALARSAIGRLTLIDMDHVAESNINRQIQALDETLGQAKTAALKARIAHISPHCVVHEIDDFVNPENASFFVLQAKSHLPLVILDCCDQSAAKVALSLAANFHQVPLALAGSAGGKTKPWLLQKADLKDVIQDPLLAKVRYQLRRHHGWSRTKSLGLTAFFSDEPVQKTDICAASAGLNCAGYGSSVAVTATMGMGMAAWAIDVLLKDKQPVYK